MPSLVRTLLLTLLCFSVLCGPAVAAQPRLTARTGWVTQPAFGLDAADAAAHPEWQLSDSFGNQLWVAGRLAADFGDPAFRSWWIARASAQLGSAHTLFIDDVLMERRTTTSWGTTRSPIDPRTGFTMSEAAWQRYMADFMVEVRAAFPSVEIVHDVVWHKGDGTADLQRQLAAADHIWLERGFSDPLIGSGTGRYGWQTLTAFIDRRASVILDAPAAGQLYGLVNYLLVENGRVTLVPGAPWTGYGTDLGAPLAARYWTGLVWRRDFERGSVLVNEPGRSARTVALGTDYIDPSGATVSSVTLSGGTGTVLAKAPTPTPTPVPPPPVAVATPTPTPVVKAPTKARISTLGRAGSRGPRVTRTTVRGTRTRLSGRVSGATSGRVRLVVERRHGRRWVAVRRAEASVRSSGFAARIAKLSRGSYRVRASFQGTGTAQPSRSVRAFRA